jgi:hypothetical protein
MRTKTPTLNRLGGRDYDLSVAMSAAEAVAAVRAERIGVPQELAGETAVLAACNQLRAALLADRLLDLGWLNPLQMQAKFTQAQKLYIAGRIKHPFTVQSYVVRCEFTPCTFVLLVDPALGAPPQAFRVQQFLAGRIDGELWLLANDMVEAYADKDHPVRCDARLGLGPLHPAMPGGTSAEARSVIGLQLLVPVMMAMLAKHHGF